MLSSGSPGPASVSNSSRAYGGKRRPGSDTVSAAISDAMTAASLVPADSSARAAESNRLNSPAESWKGTLNGL